MNVDYLVGLLTNQADLIRGLVEGAAKEEARWRPAPDAWSLLEVINHLHDEEREDFRARLDLLLHQPEAPWPPTDPMGWVTQRRYNARDLATSLQNFLAERQASLVWLDGLAEPRWDSEKETPWGGVLRAGDLLAAWVVHDQWHIQQLVQLRRAYTTIQAPPYSVDYAGTL
jgi:hypothetical protein